jgi:hypothetical protein
MMCGDESSTSSPMVKKELNSSGTSCDKTGRCRGHIEITGIGCQNVSFSMAGMENGQKSQFQHVWNRSGSEMSVSA